VGLPAELTSTGPAAANAFLALVPDRESRPSAECHRRVERRPCPEQGRAGSTSTTSKSLPQTTPHRYGHAEAGRERRPDRRRWSNLCRRLRGQRFRWLVRRRKQSSVRELQRRDHGQLRHPHFATTRPPTSRTMSPSTEPHAANSSLQPVTAGEPRPSAGWHGPAERTLSPSSRSGADGRRLHRHRP
jgi:hypothetical protein